MSTYLFPIKKFRAGYSIREVDEFFDNIHRRTTQEIREVRFTSVRSKGYAMDDVEEAIDRWLGGHRDISHLRRPPGQEIY